MIRFEVPTWTKQNEGPNSLTTTPRDASFCFGKRGGFQQEFGNIQTMLEKEAMPLSLKDIMQHRTITEKSEVLTGAG